VGNPWNAATLEWLPSEDYGNRSIPIITSDDPLWDQPTLSKEVAEGRHYLPDTVTGRRETIATSPVSARATYLMILPGDSWLTVIGALGTAGFFLLLTVKAMVLAFICGIVAIASIIGWLWESDRGVNMREAPIGGGITLPIGARGTASHSWWGTFIMLIVLYLIYCSFAYVYIHTSMRLEICPPPGASLPGAMWTLASAALLLAGSALVWFSGRLKSHGMALSTLAALACTTTAFVLDVHSWRLVHLDGTRDAWSASISILLGFQGVMLFVLLLAAPYLCVRAWRGLVRPENRATRDNIALIWHYVTLQGITGMLVIRGLLLVMD
jgi:cytochrome c oxidase subunit I+III